MPNLKFEYIWLDGYKPEQNLRSKTKVLTLENYDERPESLPLWSFDGSSTMQADGNSSDCLLKPVRVVRDPQRKNAYLVMCEVLNPDGTPHASNHRALIEDDPEFWFGFEQEYVLIDGKMPVGFPKDKLPQPQGRYYCGVGYNQVAARNLVEEHLDACLEAGLTVTGINAEVLLGQWEYQLLGKGAKKAADDLWLTRYLLFRISEKHELKVELHPKPLKGDWNGSGMHTNFSNKLMREKGGEAYMKNICESFRATHNEHIAVYGSNNEQRLTGHHETQSIDQFSYGVSDRGASIRIPISVIGNEWKGYLEDRRPASNACPYLVASKIVETVNAQPSAARSI
ncbi:MAG: glutamine synthetase beta-grasp domain-containing protein [Saprospiraceae bacterium]|nr:glutamine synthetase beta-grasp domain-containing protein [Saprospiraceae bacterium]